jgi:uncharacterized membrane protein YiaA
MNKDDIPFLAKKYRKNYRITVVVLSILIFLIGIAVLTIGLILAIKNKNSTTFIVGIIMTVASIIDLLLGILFLKNSFKNIKMMPDKVCAKRYLELRR